MFSFLPQLLVIGLIYCTATCAMNDPLLTKISDYLSIFDIKLSFPVSGDPNIVRKGEVIESPEIIYARYKRSLTDILEEVQSEDGKVELDCMLFVQIASIINADKQNNKFMLFSKPIEHSVLTASGKGEVGYIRLCDQEANDFLQGSSLVNKGQWVIKDINGNWIGLLDDGTVASMNESDWLISCKNRLLIEIEKNEIRSDKLSQYETYKKENRFNNWCLVLKGDN